ncbi:PREDICTED: uncharacterized protein LOC108748509 [Trachymyrmex septentrionalis]|uniref:uncharacterized protein LOC108748509 n=1 Tax=Trachymyrmex septentrionalis TaxID=34720 RepID=UPI00084F3850|nr:PREDICTED: uncharacterized protein LOC108748509 [Trachymyrmex septentrionalis]
MRASVVATLYPAERNVTRESSYPHYTTVLNLAGIEFPITFKGIPKFERLNAASINVYGIENKQVLPLQLTSDRKDKHQSPVHARSTRRWCATLRGSRTCRVLVSSQLSKKEHKKYFCDRCLHYFSTNEKLQSHTMDCQKINDCAIRLPSEDEKWLEFENLCNKEHVPSVVYADLECVLRRRNPTKKMRHRMRINGMSTSLDKLASYLDKNKLKIIRSKFSTLSDDEFELLTRKGVFPYEYVDCAEKLQDTRLPPRKSFYSSLTGDIVSESVYAHAANVWQQFSIRTLSEYSDLYLKIDVLLLGDIFENFRESCVASYGLDLAYYYTLPGFTWDAMLKHTGVKFELLTDIDMIMFIERGIRGGLSQCSGERCVNHCHTPNFEDAANFDASAIALDSLTGYILELDLEYPQHIHDRHTDLPFCPTRDKSPGKREHKLLATLYDKQRYVIHYRNLQQCTRHGLRVTKIHRVLQFAQSAWLRDYIELNTNFRSRAKNDFEKNLYKLMNNAVFGKTMENVRNHVDVKLLTKWDGRQLYCVECEDVYETMKRDIARFDTSDYPTDNAYGMPLANQKVPSLMKDENNGAITEFGLRAKMYAVRVNGKKDTKKVKGVKNNVVAQTITFDDYTRCLNEEIGMTRRQSCIRSKLHEVYTISESKIARSPYDDKRYVVPNSTETLPWGHWRIPL